MTRSLHVATVRWSRSGAPFLQGRYSRRHEWLFDGGARVAAAASPHIVRVPFTDPAAVDPEEAFVAALASCHMLFFLSSAAAAGHVVESYADHAEAELDHDPANPRITRVTLRPEVHFAGEVAADECERLHALASRQCFLARSVAFPVACEPVGPARR